MLPGTIQKTSKLLPPHSSGFRLHKREATLGPRVMSSPSGSRVPDCAVVCKSSAARFLFKSPCARGHRRGLSRIHVDDQYYFSALQMRGKDLPGYCEHHHREEPSQQNPAPFAYGEAHTVSMRDRERPTDKGC